METIDFTSSHDLVRLAFTGALAVFGILFCWVLFLTTRNIVKAKYIRAVANRHEALKEGVEEGSQQEDFTAAPILWKEDENGISAETQPDLCEIQMNWEPLYTIEKIGIFEMYSPTVDIFKWRLLNTNEQEVLTSTSEYVSEVTCKHGIDSVIKSIRSAAASSVKPDPFIIGVNDAKEFSYVLKAGNGKIIGMGPIVATEDEAENLAQEITVRVLAIK